MRAVIEKSRRLLSLWDGGREILHARIALGREPVGVKSCEGDGKTPEGVYRICTVKENGKYGLSLGLTYPNAADARRAWGEGAIDLATLAAVETAIQERRRPPWGSPLGGEIYLHEGAVDTDWTQGCIALNKADMAALWACRNQIEDVEIRP